MMLEVSSWSPPTPSISVLWRVLVPKATSLSCPRCRPNRAASVYTNDSCGVRTESCLFSRRTRDPATPPPMASAAHWDSFYTQLLFLWAFFFSFSRVEWHSQMRLNRAMLALAAAIIYSPAR